MRGASNESRDDLNVKHAHSEQKERKSDDDDINGTYPKSSTTIDFLLLSGTTISMEADTHLAMAMKETIGSCRRPAQLLRL